MNEIIAQQTEECFSCGCEIQKGERCFSDGEELVFCNNCEDKSEQD